MVAGSQEMLSFIKHEEEDALNKLSLKETSMLLDQIFIMHPSLLQEKMPTDTLILHQIDDKLYLKRLINMFMDKIISCNNCNNYELNHSKDTFNYLIKKGGCDFFLLTDFLTFKKGYVER